MPNASLKRRAVMALTALQHGSATFIGVFLVVHLSAPASALLGGSNASSQVMVRLSNSDSQRLEWAS